MNKWGDLSKTYANIVDLLFSYGVNLLAALFILLVGFIVAHLLDRAIAGAVKRSGLEGLLERLNLPKLLYRIGVHSSVATAAGRTVRWTVYVIAAFVAVDTLGVEAFSSLRDQFISYLPRLISSVAMLLCGLLLADLARTLVKSAVSENGLVENPDLVGKLAYVVVALVTFSLSLEQAGLEMTLVRNLLVIMLAAAGLTFAISFGFSSQQVARNLIARPYVERMLKPEDLVTLDGKGIGVVRTFAAQSVVMVHEGHETFIPYTDFLQYQVGIENLRDDGSASAENPSNY